MSFIRQDHQYTVIRSVAGCGHLTFGRSGHLPFLEKSIVCVVTQVARLPVPWVLMLYTFFAVYLDCHLLRCYLPPFNALL